MFFDNFKYKIKSTNYSEIEYAVNDGYEMLLKGLITSPKYGRLISDVIETSNTFDFSKFNPDNPNDLERLQQYLEVKVNNSAIAVALAAVVAAAAVVWEGIAIVNEVALVTFHFKAWATSSTLITDKEGLTKENLIVEISNAFK